MDLSPWHHSPWAAGYDKLLIVADGKATVKKGQYSVKRQVDKGRQSPENVPALPSPEKARVCPHCSHALAPGEIKVCAACGRSLVPPARKKPGIAARWGVPAAVGAVLIAGCIYFDLTMNPHSVFRRIFQRSEPVYQWVQSEDKTFSFLPGESKAWGPVDPQQAEIHYVINSYLPVDTGLIEEAQWGENTDAALKKSSACYESKIVHSVKACQVTTGKPLLIFIRDIRAKQVPLGGSPSALSRKAVQDQNSVTVTVFKLKCMEHCR